MVAAFVGGSRAVGKGKEGTETNNGRVTNMLAV